MQLKKAMNEQAGRKATAVLFLFATLKLVQAHMERSKEGPKQVSLAMEFKLQEILQVPSKL